MSEKTNEKKKAYYQNNKARIKEEKKAYYQVNKTRIIERSKTRYKMNKEKLKQAFKVYAANNKDKMTTYRNNYKKRNPKKGLESSAKYRDANRNTINKLAMERSKTDESRNKKRKYMQYQLNNNLHLKIKLALSGRIYKAVKSQNAVKNYNTLTYCSCTVEFLFRYLESKFVNGMTWENYGEWHIDHIRPCSSFDFTDPEQQKQCFNYTNLQPLWAIDNLRKSDKLNWIKE